MMTNGITLGGYKVGLDGCWKYQNDDGTYQENGWFHDYDGKSCYFDSNGRMLYDTVTPDG